MVRMGKVFLSLAVVVWFLMIVVHMIQNPYDTFTTWAYQKKINPDVIDLNTVVDYEITESGLSLYTEQGQEYKLK